MLKDRAEQSQVDSQIVRLVSDLSALKNKVDAIQARGTFSQQEITEVSASATTIMSDLNEVRVGVSEVFAPVWYEGIDDENSS